MINYEILIGKAVKFLPIFISVISVAQVDLTVNGSLLFNASSWQGTMALPLDKVPGWSMINSCDFHIRNKSGNQIGMIGNEFAICELTDTLHMSTTIELTITNRCISKSKSHSIRFVFLTESEMKSIDSSNVFGLEPESTLRVTRRRRNHCHKHHLKFQPSGGEKYVLFGLFESDLTQGTNLLVKQLELHELNVKQ